VLPPKFKEETAKTAKTDQDRPQGRVPWDTVPITGNLSDALEVKATKALWELFSLFKSAEQPGGFDFEAFLDYIRAKASLSLEPAPLSLQIYHV
jgi:hypothetical protein